MNPHALAVEDGGINTRRGPSLSHSRINRYLTCPEQYRLHYVERLRARVTSAGLVFGQALHEALAGLFRDGSDPVKSFADVWGSVAGLDLAYSRYDSWQKLQDAGNRLLEKFLKEAAPRITNVSAVEKPFEIAVTGFDLPFTGVIDLVADLDGVATVIDFKTGASDRGEHEALLSDQLSVYGLAEPEAVQAALCVLTRTKEPRITWHVTTRGADQLNAYLTKAGHVTQDIAAGRFYKRPGMWCSWCDFLPVCIGDTVRVEETLIQVR